MMKTSSSHFAEYDLAKWLSYIEQIHNTEIDLGLERSAQVLANLNIDFSFAKVITVAGTNGKGTTCAFLENALLAIGKSVAVYSSPHIERFNERLRINKRDIDDISLVEAFRLVEQARGDISLSYYEFTTLAAFIVLMVKKPEYIILEVGLGGRLDATNIIDSDIAVITTIDLDHQAFLGDNREAIGKEKAGIMRSNRPAVIGELDMPSSISEFADEIGANLFARGQHFTVSGEQGTWMWQSNQHSLSLLNQPHIPRDNVATALKVLSLLDYPLSQELVNQLINETRVSGRTELFKRKSDVILDVGHNPQAARYLHSFLKAKPYKKIHAVIGMMHDKDIKSTLDEVSEIIEHWYLAKLDMPRAASAQEISTQLTDKQANVNCFDNVYDAFKMAEQNAEKDDLVLVFGSFFTVAPIRKLLVHS